MGRGGKGKGGWGGWGWGKGWGPMQFWNKRPSGPPKQTVPDDFALDTAKVYTGTVSAYWKLNGYGFIELDEKGVIPGDKVFCFWQSINSSDRFPFLVKESKVQCTLEKEQKRGATTIKACNVSQVGGAPIAIQDESDGKKKFVGGQHLRYTGTLKFFIPKRGYGYVAIDDGFKYDVEGVPKEIRVEHSEVNCGGKNPGYMKEIQVEFGIWQTQKGAFKAYNMTAPGGTPLPEGDHNSPENK
jgi:cold shock CspA family protein